MSTLEAKKAAGRRAVDFVRDGMIVGLGTGSTSNYFIESLLEKTKHGLKIQAVASSRKSAELAKKGGIEVLDINNVSHVDLTVDGADEVDPQKRMIKGAGGAHVREKILASASNEMIAIVDESKLVSSLGNAKLPVEILFYGSPATQAQLEELGFQGKWRMNEDGTLFVTENGNLLLDIRFTSPINAPEEVDRAITSVPGVVATGFFFELAKKIIVGRPDGTTDMF